MNREATAALLHAEHLLAARKLDAALRQLHYAESIGADPDRCAAGRWTVQMLFGAFAEAWRESDAIRVRGRPDPHRLWRGETLDGKRVILRCLHGFGDAVQFLRYAPRLRGLAASLVVEVNPRFVELARHFEGTDEVITWGEAAPAKAPEWDVQIEIMELPYLFRTGLEELPLADCYLRLPARSTAGQIKSQRNEPGPLRVGLVWTAGGWNSGRSMPFSALQALLEVPGCEFWSLESGGTDQDALYADQFAALRQDAAAEASILGLAESIARMDLVITVDTLAPHLAGALGVPCWVLLEHAADWRWMHEREDSPWYPTLRLLRQPAPGDWTSALTKAHALLQQRVIMQRELVCAE